MIFSRIFICDLLPGKSELLVFKTISRYIWKLLSSAKNINFGLLTLL